MKEKIKNALLSKWAMGLYALALSLLMTWQETGLGNRSTAWAMGLAVALGFGLFAVAARYVTAGGWKWGGLLPWAIGGVLGTIAGYLI